jgi:hypothetical protein
MRIDLYGEEFAINFVMNAEVETPNAKIPPFDIGKRFGNFPGCIPVRVKEETEFREKLY